MDLSNIRERLRLAAAIVLNVSNGEVARNIRRGDLFLLIHSRGNEEIHLALEDATSDAMVIDYAKMTRAETIMLTSMNFTRQKRESQLLFKVIENITHYDCLITVISQCIK